MLHVLNVVHTSFACALMNTTSPLSQAAACWAHFAATTEPLWQNVLRQATAWLLIHFTLCRWEDDARYSFPSVDLRRAAVCAAESPRSKNVSGSTPKKQRLFCVYFDCFFFLINWVSEIHSRYVMLCSVNMKFELWPSVQTCDSHILYSSALFS